MSDPGLLDPCANPDCRRVGTVRLQAGHLDDNWNKVVEHDLYLCAYCAPEFRANFRADNLDGFIQEVHDDPINSHDI